LRENDKCNFENANIPRTIAVDFDGVIAKYSGWKGHDHYGEPIRGVKTAMKMLRKWGFKVIVYTCRADVRGVARYLRQNNIVFDYINENPYQPPDVHPSKLYADFYIDDRAITFTNWRDTLSRLNTLINRKFDVVVYDYSSDLYRGTGTLRAWCRNCGYSFGEYFSGSEAGLECAKCGTSAKIKIIMDILEVV